MNMKAIAKGEAVPTARYIGVIGVMGIISGAIFKSPLLMAMGAFLVGANLSPIMPIWEDGSDMDNNSRKSDMRYYFWLAPASVIVMILLYTAGSLLNL